MPTQFKLKFDSLTRRAVFAHNPSWPQLSAKIAALFSLPQHQVAVTYRDDEDEEITLSTEDELQDYYLSSFRPGDVVKFSVRDLAHRNQSPEQAPPFRNTFGQFPDLDIPGLGEWQSVGNVPSLEEILGHSEVRTVPSEAREDNRDVQSEASEPLIPVEDKGKEKAGSQSSMTSTRSLLAEDAGDKYPVHVYDVSAYHPSSDPSAFSIHEPGPAAAAQSTPRPSASLLDQVESTSEKKSQDVDDPPLPSFSPNPAAECQSQSSAGLTRDVASFLNIVSNIVSSHPEIGESLRTIARNTSNGTYWAAHRDAISQAAAEFQRNTMTMAEEGRRMAETEAGRRIAEAFASVLNIFSHAPPATTIEAEASTHPVTTPPLNETTTQPAETLNRADTPSMPGAFSSAGPDARFGGAFPFSGRRWRPPVPMPSELGPGGGNFPPWAWHSHHNPNFNATTHQGPSSHFTNAFAPVATPDTKPEMSVGNEANGRPSPQDLKAKVEQAKKVYKAEKERYRKDRDERRKEKDQPAARNEGDLTTSQNNVTNGSIPEIAHIASNARHDFPRFDIVNVTEPTPQRHDPPSPRRAERSSEDLYTRAVSRISRRLADMGFTEKSHPDLPQKIRNYLPADGAITRESEDDIVTSLLEAMLTAPKSPVASGSRDVPGGWP